MQQIEQNRGGGVFRVFTAHPDSVGESYLEHAGFAFSFAARLIVAGLAATVHAILPFAFERTAGRIVCDLADRIRARAAE